MIVAVDFDGTCVTHKYPAMGENIGAESILKRIVEKGHKIILLTMRSDQYLDEAVEWFNKNSIPLWGINKNPEQKQWTNSPKVYAHLYIDDAALGCPLIRHEYDIERPFVNWNQVEIELIERNIISKETNEEST